MYQEKDKIVLEAQLALFFKNSPVDRPDKIFVDLNNKTGNIFDDIPIILPVPNEPDFYGAPVVQLRSINKEYRCNIARSRIDFNYFPKTDITDIDKQYSHFEKLVKKIYLGVNDLEEINRIGIIFKFFVVFKDPKKVLEELLVNKNDDTFDIIIKRSSKVIIEGTQMNNVVLLEQGVLDDNKQKGIIITRDFNTLIDRQEKIDNDLVSKVYKEIIKKIDLDDLSS